MKKYNIQAESITDYIAGYDIDQAKKKYNLKKVIKLASNENPYGVSPGLVRYLKKDLKNIYRYPDQSYKGLTETLAEKLGLNPSEIFTGNGSDEILDLFFKAFIRPGDKVIIFTPSFSFYTILTEIYRAKAVKIKLKNFQYNIDDILKTLKNDIKAVILCNPNNPTGTYLNKNCLEKLVTKLNKEQFLCIDEAYHDFSTAEDFPDCLELFKQNRDKKNILVTRTFSKIYSLAGLRIGYAFAGKKFMQLLNKIRIPFNINLPAERAARYSFRNNSFPDKIRKLNSECRDYFYSALDKLKLPYTASEANFILIKMPLPGREVFDHLLKKGIIIRPFNDPELKYYVRITIGTKGELKKLLKEIKKILE